MLQLKQKGAGFMLCNRKSSSLYRLYRKYGKTTEKSQLIRTVEFADGEDKYVIHTTLFRAKKSTVIHCKDDGAIYREELYPFGGMSRPSSVTSLLVKPTVKDGETVIVVIRGKPATVVGLDDGRFLSAHKARIDRNSVYAMTEKEFKTVGASK